ncbi:hypothetical protein [Sedimentibacter sp.]|uniref:hypothetical protein n=1 Tax=Sedimentibacter sp. TaxID=1960295 RepID=UPI00289DA679|nr:hypothetical protein [Sedimentibacter sp.]
MKNDNKGVKGTGVKGTGCQGDGVADGCQGDGVADNFDKYRHLPKIVSTTRTCTGKKA